MNKPVSSGTYTSLKRYFKNIIGVEREKYDKLLRKFQQEMVKNAELERTCQQQAHQLDNQNEMIANLIKERRKRNWEKLGVDNHKMVA